MATNNISYHKTDEREYKNRSMKLVPFGGSFTPGFPELMKHPLRKTRKLASPEIPLKRFLVMLEAMQMLLFKNDEIISLKYTAYFKNLFVCFKLKAT